MTVYNVIMHLTQRYFGRTSSRVLWNGGTIS